MYRIVRKDLQLKSLKKRRTQELTAANRDARLTRAKKLLRLYPQSAVDFIFCSNENIFTVAPPDNRVYVQQSSKKRTVASDRLLRTSNVEQVADGVGRCVQARVHGADFRPARG